MYKNIFLCFFLILTRSLSWGLEGKEALSEEENIYQKIANVAITVKGREYPLSAFYSKNPIIIAQIFTRCTGICMPFLLQLKTNLQFIQTGKSYKILVLSFDPRDSESDMQQLAETFSLQNDSNWIFATTDEIETLNNSTGFRALWDSSSLQYSHEALLTGINSEGIIKKKLIGMKNREAISNLISEINHGFIPSYSIPGQNSMLNCFNYDPVSGKNKPGIGFLIMAVPALATFLLVLLLGYLSKRLYHRRT